MDLLESVLSALSGEAFVADKNGDIIAVNRAWTEAVLENRSFPAKAKVGDNYLRVCRAAAADGRKSAGAGAARAADGIETVLSGKAADFKLKYTRNFQSGAQRFLMTATRLERERGGALVVHQNVTRQERFDTEKLHNRLKNSEERFSKLFNFIPLSMTVSSLGDHRFVDVNECFAQLTGIRREDAIGRTARETGILMPEEDVRHFFDILDEKGSVNNFETEICRPNGELLTILLYAVKMEIEGEEFLAVAANDITERKGAERAMRDLTTRLLNLQDKERRRIARELHDATAQRISAVLLTLSYLKKIIAAPDKTVSGAIDEAISMTERSLGEIRTLSYLLHPPLLDQMGLDSALRWFVGGFIKRSGIEVEIVCAGLEERLPIEMESALFRIVQESLNNVHRHSGSGRAFIRLNRDTGEAILEIRDEGGGIVEGGEVLNGDFKTLGVGIAGMSERLRQFGGELSIKSGSSGTIIRARIPLV